MTEFIGSKISLISRSDIRYVGILHEINSEESTVALEQVRSFGTEGRRGGDPKDEVPASDNVFEYIVFRGSDVKDLKVEEAAKKVEPPPRGVPDDPAILATTAPPPRSQQSPLYPPMHQYQPPPPPGYPNYQYPPPPFGGPAGFRPPPQHMSPPQGYAYPNYPPGMPPPRGYGGPSPSLEKQPQQQPPPQQSQTAAGPPSPVKETKPDVATAIAPVTTAPAPAPIKPNPTQPLLKTVPVSIVPAMPIPVSIPVQSRVTQPRPQPAKPSPAVSPTRNPIVETAKVATAADVQFLAKNLSETKLSNNVPGAGGYLTQPRRRQFATAASRPMDQDYDFETANAKFNKEDVAKEVKSAGVNGTNETGPSAATVAAALASTEDNFYNPGKSFFDNISCENKDRTATTTTTDGAANPNSWKRGEERKLNMETFGQASIDYGNGRFGRGGYRGGRGGYRGGRGGAGYYPRGAGRGVNPWRGGAPRTNGQNTAETTT